MSNTRAILILRPICTGRNPGCRVELEDGSAATPGLRHSATGWISRRALFRPTRCEQDTIRHRRRPTFHLPTLETGLSS